MKHMNLTPKKYEILENLLLQDVAVKPAQIAEEIGEKFPQTMMHIIGLSRMGYAHSPEKGLYKITEKGKNALGLPEINPEKAKQILAQTPEGKFFHFYASIGKPLNTDAKSLQDFSERILKISSEAVEFHTRRGDFEAWFEGLGDLELAKKTGLLKRMQMSREEIQAKLYKIVKKRCIELARFADLAASS